MSDFAPNYTARYRYRYSSLGKTHSQTWRVIAGTTDPAAVAAKVGLYLADMAGDLYADFHIISAEFALADSDVFLPAPLPDEPTGAVSVGAGDAGFAAIAISFVGRTIAGGKARMFQYGTALGIPLHSASGADWKYLSSEDEHISDAVVRLNETSPAIVGNDNEAVVWYEYVNVKPNDRWVRKLRRG